MIKDLPHLASWESSVQFLTHSTWLTSKNPTLANPLALRERNKLTNHRQRFFPIKHKQILTPPFYCICWPSYKLTVCPLVSLCSVTWTTPINNHKSLLPNDDKIVSASSVQLNSSSPCFHRYWCSTHFWIWGMLLCESKWFARAACFSAYWNKWDYFFGIQWH